MKTRSLSFVLALLMGAAPALPQFVDTPEKRDARLQWWRDARFGMFIHWGLYAVPAGEWKGQPIAGIGEWIMNRAKIPVGEYEQLAKQFNPVKFNAEEWVKVAAAAGQKYITITSKHHDGFAMYKSQVSKFNIVDATPFHRDPMAELAAACKRHGIKLCFYYSQAQDWNDPNGAGNSWAYPDENKKDFAKYFNEKVKPQVREILTQYGPIGMIWFDTPQKITKEQSTELANFVHSIQPACLVSGRVGHDVGDYSNMGDNQIPARVLDYDWETPVTLNDTWGFKKDDHNWKSTQTLIRQLTDVVAKNGNYLLNVGPTAEGVIPQPSVDRLLEVGKWMKVNSEAVYGAKPSPFVYEFEWGAITTKPGKLYLHVIDWPKGEFVLNGLKSKVKTARLLTQPGAALKIAQTADANKNIYSLRIQVPANAPDKDVSVIVLDIDGKPDVVKTLQQQSNGTVVLSPMFAQEDAGRKFNIDPRGVTTRWMTPEGKLTWNFDVAKGGAFDVVLVTTETRVAKGGDSMEGGHVVKISVAGNELTGKIENGERVLNARNPRWKDMRTTAGRVKLSGPGNASLSLQPQQIGAKNGLGLTLRAVELVPAK